MTRNIEHLRAAEEAAVERLKMLLDARDDALAAMEHANTIVVSGSKLSAKDLQRLVPDTYHQHLARAVHSQFYMLIDEAEHHHWMAKIAVEEAESEPSSLTEYAQAAE